MRAEERRGRQVGKEGYREEKTDAQLVTRSLKRRISD